jgi:hypothetical protein
LHANNMSLDYAPLRRLEEQKKAFAVHFNAYRRMRPEIASLEPLLQRTIGEAAFWGGARAFDDGDVRLCDAFLACASATWGDIGSWEPYRRLRWNAASGAIGSRWLQVIAARVRGVSAGLARREAGPEPESRRSDGHGCQTSFGRAERVDRAEQRRPEDRAVSDALDLAELTAGCGVRFTICGPLNDELRDEATRRGAHAVTASSRMFSGAVCRCARPT